MGAVSVRRRGAGSPDPPKTLRAPPATLVPNGIAMAGCVHGQSAGFGLVSVGLFLPFGRPEIDRVEDFRSLKHRSEFHELVGRQRSVAHPHHRHLLLLRHALIVALHERSTVGRRARGRRDGRRLERFAEVCQGLTSRGRSHPGLLPLANLRFDVSRRLPAVSSQSDVATAPRALQRKLLAHLSHEFGPSDPGGVVRSRFVA